MASVKNWLIVSCSVLCALMAGCGGSPARPENHSVAQPASGTTSEADTLSNIVQLTRGFDRAGEAYFSPDMKWIVFEAVPKGQEHYQMYLARLRYSSGWISGADDPIPISPEPS